MLILTIISLQRELHSPQPLSKTKYLEIVLVMYIAHSTILHH